MLDAAQADLAAQMAARRSQESSPYEVIMGFAHAVNWKEPLIVAMLTWHVLACVAAVATSGELMLHTGLFFILGALVLAAYPLNMLGSQHWQEVATQDYFDDGGVFMSVMWSLPQVLVLLGMLVNIVWKTGQTMVRVKVLQLKAKRRKAQQADKEKAD